MKHLKKLNEDWSNDYTYDFTDAGFEVEENGLILTGKYKGQFVMTQINDWFAEMTAKMSDDHEVARTKTYFNQVTGNANFEVEITPKRNFSIEIQVGNEKVEFFPIEVSNYRGYHLEMNGDMIGNIWFKGSLKNGQKKELGVTIKNNQIRFTLSNRSRGISVSNEEITKIFDKILSNEMKLGEYDENPPYRHIFKSFNEISQEEKRVINRLKDLFTS